MLEIAISSYFLPPNYGLFDYPLMAFFGTQMHEWDSKRINEFRLSS
jgi:hypothetical protein